MGLAVLREKHGYDSQKQIFSQKPKKSEILNTMELVHDLLKKEAENANNNNNNNNNNKPDMMNVDETNNKSNEKQTYAIIISFERKKEIMKRFDSVSGFAYLPDNMKKEEMQKLIDWLRSIEFHIDIQTQIEVSQEKKQRKSVFLKINFLCLLI